MLGVLKFEAEGLTNEMAQLSQTEKSDIFKRLKTLEDLPRLPADKENWLKRNAYWFFPCVSVFLALVIGSGALSLLAGAFVDKRIYAQNTETSSRLRKVEDSVARVETKLDTFTEVLKPLITQRLKIAAELAPDDLKGVLPQLESLAEIGKRENILEPEETITALAQKTLKLSNYSSDADGAAWRATIALLNYRSFVSALPNEATLVSPLPPGKVWAYVQNEVFSKPRSRLSFSSDFGVPQDQAARLDTIGEDKNKNQTRGPLFLVAEGGAASLDNQHIRSVFFQNVEVHYSGAQAILENVHFIKCTFVFDASAQSKKLSGEMLASMSVNFKSGV